MENTHVNIQEEPGRRTHLLDYYFVLRKRLWLIVSILFVTVLVTTLYTFSMRSVYQATAGIIIGKEAKRSPLTGKLLEYDSYVSQQLTFRTHFQMVTARPVLERVLEQVDISDDSLELPPIAKFFSTVKTNISRLLKSIFPGSNEEKQPPSRESLLADRIARLRSKIRVKEVEDTRLLRIQVEDYNPRTARDLANALAENYIIYDSSTRLESSRKMLQWLNNQLYAMRKKVEEAEKAFLDFKEKANLFSIEGKQRLNTQKIEDMNASYLEARSQRMAVEAKINELKKFIKNSANGHIQNIPTFIKNSIVESLYSELLATEIDYKKMSGVFKHKHPEMIKVTSKLTELRRKIREQIEKSLVNAESERAVLMAKEKALKEAMASYEKEAIDTNRSELQYAILKREVESNREIYNILLAKIKEANITDEITKTSLRLVDPASAPSRPIRPKKAKNIILSIIFGLVAGMGLAFFLEYMDQTVHNREELEWSLDLPVLAEIPRAFCKTKPQESQDAVCGPTVLNQPLTGRFYEAFSTLATNLRFADLNRRGVYMITSSSPSEGKSTTCLNLGLTLSQLGRKTLLIDADLRLPANKKIIRFADNGSLVEILVDTFNTPITQGLLGELGAGDIHRLLELQERTGVLTYENGTDVFTVSFEKGQIIHVDWPSRPSRTRLGNLLLRCGKITREQAQIAMAKQRSTDQRLGQVLLHLGFITPEELAGPLKLHISENVRALNKCQQDACKQARFSFKEEPSTSTAAADPKEMALREAMGGLDGISSYTAPYLLAEITKRVCQLPGSDLWVLPSGSVPPNPPELLASRRLRVLMELLRRQFDVILIDTPPVATVSDAAVLAGECDGVVLVVRAGATDLRLIKRALDQLDAVEAKVVGVVLNMLDSKKDPYYYGRYASDYDDYYRRPEEKTEVAEERHGET
ncbi:MAG: polysaccharide biosynthesis tyrosine autokinase [Deltaproteobacteria bacterium]|nr:polysaccharide biosynthesis tyrosine autokinase [Deltaproteobacteria bacterium]MBW2071003.1 polysaccharide biosynthesis tyrosine autokinase [Deltaproteobacteria bacterium]